MLTHTQTHRRTHTNILASLCWLSQEGKAISTLRFFFLDFFYYLLKKNWWNSIDIKKSLTFYNWHKHLTSICRQLLRWNNVEENMKTPCRKTTGNRTLPTGCGRECSSFLHLDGKSSSFFLDGAKHTVTQNHIGLSNSTFTKLWQRCCCKKEKYNQEAP